MNNDVNKEYGANDSNTENDSELKPQGFSRSWLEIIPITKYTEEIDFHAKSVAQQIKIERLRLHLIQRLLEIHSYSN